MALRVVSSPLSSVFSLYVDLTNEMCAGVLPELFFCDTEHSNHFALVCY